MSLITVHGAHQGRSDRTKNLDSERPTYDTDLDRIKLYSDLILDHEADQNNYGAKIRINAPGQSGRTIRLPLVRR